MSPIEELTNEDIDIINGADNTLNNGVDEAVVQENDKKTKAKKPKASKPKVNKPAKKTKKLLDVIVIASPKILGWW